MSSLVFHHHHRTLYCQTYNTPEKLKPSYTKHAKQLVHINARSVKASKNQIKTFSWARTLSKAADI